MKFLPYYPSLHEPDFQQKIYNKKEFQDLSLDIKEGDEESGVLRPHQRIIQRFMSTFTPYDGLLVVHAMGTGKTRVAIGVTESLRKSGAFKRAIILEKSNSLLDKFVKELIHVSEDLNLLPVDTTLEDPRKKNTMRPYYKAAKHFYTFETHLKFAKDIGKIINNHQAIKERYSNTIFILDEVHNMRPTNTQEEVGYDILLKLFHTVENSKILLLSGTPMKDGAEEIADVMNLILPEGEQLPRGQEFLKTFFESEGGEMKNVDQLQDAFHGRVSYLRPPPSDVDYTFIGKSFDEPDIQEFRVYKTKMEYDQAESYTQAFETDKESRGIYNNASQASLFVFPDGSWGEEGWNHYTEKTTYTVNRRQMIKHNLNTELQNLVKNLETLKHMSCKYAAVIDDILKHPRQIVFVYCSVVSGSGIRLLAKILGTYGFAQLAGKTTEKRRRYALLTGDATDANISRVLQTLNHRNNLHGDYCQVILGSRKIAEGFTFKNVQRIHIVTPFWNYTETSQAIARGIRFNSHADLILENPNRKINVRIYQHTAIVDPEVPSLDLIMYSYSKTKDMVMKKIDRLLKETSMDCPLTRVQNMGNKDYSRECDYEKCSYICRSFDNPDEPVDLNTYELYYDEQNIATITEKIIQLFTEHFFLSYETIKEIVQPLSDFQLLKALSSIIENNTVIINAHGVSSYLRDRNNYYFLMDEISLPNSIAMAKYTERPVIGKKSSITSYVEKYLNVKAVILKISQSRNIEEFGVYMKYLSLEIQEEYLEAIFLSDNENLKNYATHHFRDFLLRKDDGTLISTLLPNEHRSFQNGKWRDCVTQESEMAQPELLEKNPWGYYGIVNGDNFCIKDLSISQVEDKRKRSTGAHCEQAGWKKSVLVDLILNKFKIKPNSQDYETWKKATETTGNSQENLNAFWSSQTKKYICKALREWFTEHGLITRGPCGVRGKRK